jgi:hypothetical protein
MNRLRKLECLVLTLLKLMIAVRMGGVFVSRGGMTRIAGRTEIAVRRWKVAPLRWSAFCLLGLVVMWPAALRTRDPHQDFDVFFAKFKLAVAQKDSATLMTLMMSAFNFIRAQNVSPSDVFKGLDANGGLQWTNLQQSVQGQPMLYRFPDSNTPTRVLQCTPTDSIYMCLVMFQQDMHHHWRWKSMIMPTR